MTFAGEYNLVRTSAKGQRGVIGAVGRVSQPQGGKEIEKRLQSAF